MIDLPTGQIWLIIGVLGVGTYLIRFSFLGLLGAKALPPWILRHLRYSAVSILPALIAPLVIWPGATGGETDPARLAAAIIALGIGWLTKNAIWAIVAGMGTLWALLALLG